MSSLRCGDHWNFVGIYLGDETRTHQEAIREGREGFFEDVDGDLTIRCEKSDQLFLVHRHFLCTQSKVIADKSGPRLYKPDGTQWMTEICLRHPVTPRYLRAVIDVAYTFDYAVYGKDVAMSRTYLHDMNVRCNTCKNHCRLLSFHLGVLRAGISLGMDEVRPVTPVVVEKYRRALEGAPVQIIQFAITDVYSSKIFIPGQRSSASWTSGLVNDCRPDMVVPACVKYIESCRREAGDTQQNGCTEENQPRGREEFRDLCREFPEFQLALDHALEGSARKR